MNESINPFQRGTVGLFNFPPWVGYTFGSFFIAIGILLFFYVPRANRRAQAFKARQLDNYNALYHRHETDYAKTGMYLPAWERTKQIAPLILGVTFVIIGIAWIVGNSLTTL